MAVKRAAKAALAATGNIAEKGSLSEDKMVGDLDGKADGNWRTNATVSGGSAEMGDEYNLRKLLHTLSWLTKICGNR